MHAVVIDVTIDDVSAAQRELDELVPRVSSTPGFVAGYWVALPPDKGTSMVVFDSAESAQAFLDVVAGTPPMAVTVDSVQHGEVIASA